MSPGLATNGPATRLLEAFCALAGEWLAKEAELDLPVDCEPHGGRFTQKELEDFALRPPSIRAGCLGVASAAEDGEGAAVLDLSLAAVVVAGDGPREDRAAKGRRLADRVAFELTRIQPWAKRVFKPEELDRNRTDAPRGHDIGEPREIRALNMYNGKLNDDNVAIWAVTWLQQFRAIPSDFDLPLPVPAGIPDTVKAGYDPAIGPGHEGDYEQVVPEGGS